MADDSAALSTGGGGAASSLSTRLQAHNPSGRAGGFMCRSVKGVEAGGALPGLEEAKRASSLRWVACGSDPDSLEATGPSKLSGAMRYEDALFSEVVCTFAANLVLLARRVATQVRTPMTYKDLPPWCASSLMALSLDPGLLVVAGATFGGATALTPDSCTHPLDAIAVKWWLDGMPKAEAGGAKKGAKKRESHKVKQMLRKAIERVEGQHQLGGEHYTRAKLRLAEEAMQALKPRYAADLEAYDETWRSGSLAVERGRLLAPIFVGVKDPVVVTVAFYTSGNSKVAANGVGVGQSTGKALREVGIDPGELESIHQREAASNATKSLQETAAAMTGCITVEVLHSVVVPIAHTLGVGGAGGAEWDAISDLALMERMGSTFDGVAVISAQGEPRKGCIATKSAMDVHLAQTAVGEPLSHTESFVDAVVTEPRSFLVDTGVEKAEARCGYCGGPAVKRNIHESDDLRVYLCAPELDDGCRAAFLSSKVWATAVDTTPA